jgi:hypothetical protein
MRKWIPIGIFVVIFLVGAFLSPKIGPSWDEPDNIYAGGIYLTFFKQKDPKVLVNSWNVTNSAFGDRIYTQQASMERYPPVPLIFGAVVTAILEKIHAATAFEIIGYYHVASALLLAILAVSVYLLSQQLGLSVFSSFLASLFTVCIPTMFGHGLSTIKDVGQASLFTASMTALFTGTVTKKWRFIVLGGIIWGLGMATKFNAIYVPIIWGIWSTLFFLTKRRSKVSVVSIINEWILPGAVVGLVGIVVMFLAWPYLWFDPVNRFMGVIRYFTAVGTGYKVVFDGRDAFVGDYAPIWWYPIGYLALSTPIPALIAILGGIGMFFLNLIRKKEGMAKWAILIIWIAIPLGRAFLPRSAYYDGIRHFIEIFPPLSILALYGIETLTKELKKRLHFSTSVRDLILLIIGAGIVVHMIVIDALFFPYSTGYLNAFAKNQNTNFDRDFSGLSIKEAITFIKTKYPNMQLFTPVAGHLSWYYITPGDHYVYTIEDADTIVLANKASHVRKADLDALVGNSFTVVYTITRGNSVFGWVYRRI